MFDLCLSALGWRAAVTAVVKRLEAVVEAEREVVVPILFLPALLLREAGHVGVHVLAAAALGGAGRGEGRRLAEPLAEGTGLADGGRGVCVLLLVVLLHVVVLLLRVVVEVEGDFGFL